MTASVQENKSTHTICISLLFCRFGQRASKKHVHFFFNRSLLLNSRTFPGLSHQNFRIPGLFQFWNFSFQISGLCQDSRTCVDRHWQELFVLHPIVLDRNSCRLSLQTSSSGLHVFLCNLVI